MEKCKAKMERQHQQYFCTACQTQIDLSNKESHESGKRHMKKCKIIGPTPLQQANFDQTQIILKPKLPKLLYIRGYTGYTNPEDIESAFSQFGPVVLERFNKGYGLVQLQTEQAAEAAVARSGNIFVYGTPIQIRYFEPTIKEIQGKIPPKREFIRSKNKEKIIEPHEIDLRGTFVEQCDNILREVRMTREQVESTCALYSNLQELLQTVWPGCKAMPFGSITTGLGIQTSDADCFVEIPERFRAAGHHSYVPKAKNLMKKFPHIFAEVLAIPRANTPIIKFFHIPTQMNCDVSFKTPLGSRNSQLIEFLLKKDDRLLILCVLIKYWAKVHGLTGTGRLSNYALTMLVIFYLQQQPSPMLHSIAFYQRGVEYHIDGWNTGFRDRPDAPLHNASRLSELLGGFFQFYAKFNFKEYFACPYTGVAVEKKLFENLNNLNEMFALYKRNVMELYAFPLKLMSEMVVQDPFEHSRNICSCVGNRLFNEIVQTIEWAAKAYEDDVPYNCSNFLRKILLEKPEIVQLNSHPTFKIFINHHVTKALPEEWMDLVRDTFYSIFKNILKFSIEPLVSKEEDKKQQPEGAENPNKVKEIYLLRGAKVTWKKRKEHANEKRLDLLDKQIAITKRLIKDGLPEMISLHILAELIFSQRDRKAHVILKLENDINQKFGDFGNFCIGNLGQWFQKLLMKHVLSAHVNSSSLINIPVTGNETENTAAEKTAHSETESGKEKCGMDKQPETVSGTATGGVDIPSRPRALSESQNSSPDSNPPAKIKKTEL